MGGAGLPALLLVFAVGGCVLFRPVHKPPPASHKSPGRQILDARRPCLTRDQARRVRRTLFPKTTPRDAPRWVGAINTAMHALGADCGDDALIVLVVTTIQIESGVRADPPLAERDLESLFLRRWKQFQANHAIAAGLISLSDLESALRAKLRRDTARGRVRRESDLVRYVERDLRPWLTALVSEKFPIPEFLARVVGEKWVPPGVTTFGPMQVNAAKAYRNARARKEPIASPRAMRDLLLDPRTAVERGILEGIALLLKGYRYYRPRLDEDTAVRFAAVDYNAGEYSARNAAFQEMLARLLNRNLALDGDLLIYEGGTAAAELSSTESAVLRELRGFTPGAIRRDLLREKQASFSRTPVAKAVCERFRRESGSDCPVARMPTGAANPGAGVKLGRTYTPANYARAVTRRYRENRARYAAGRNG